MRASLPPGAPRRYPRPALLDQLPAGSSVLEASAGTGKTWTLEHLVLDLLLTEGMALEQILVVTFTEKAAREMRERIRGKLQELLDGSFEREAGTDEPHWLLDGPALAALDRALVAFDRASISTIHGFCQRLLQETAFLSGRPFQTTMVDSRELLRRAFRACVRTRWAVPGSAWARRLDESLRALKGEENLFRLLDACHREPGLRHPAERDPAGAARALGAMHDPQRLEAELREAGISKGNSIAKVLDGIQAVLESAERQDWGALQEILKQAFGSRPLVGWKALADLAATQPASQAAATARALGDLGDALPNPHGTAADAFLEELREAAQELKARDALMDFDDMLAEVDQALRSEGGPLLADRLRSRFKAALIDEFQDTSRLQWDIFRTVFHRPGWRLVLIGDPKQAIYGFRGGDIHTYSAAQASILGEKRPLRLEANFRSTPRLVAAYNRILEQDSPEPFFQGPVRYDQPVQPGRPELRWVDAGGRDLPAIRLVRVPLSADKEPVARIRRRLARHLAGNLRDLLDSGACFVDPRDDRTRPLDPGDIFVLTHNRREAALMAEALRDAGVEAAFYKREGVFQSDEALDFLNLLKAIADPGDPSLRAKAWITPVFGVALDHLAACRDLPESHPLLERLRSWHGLAKEGRMADLFREILGGGLLRRLLRTEPDDRSAGIWMQLAEFALEQGEGHPGGFEETVRRFGDYVEGRAQPPGEDADVHRMKSDRPAVQILTMHKAKGLEAAVVAVFGGFSEGRSGAVHHFFDGAARRFWVGLQPSPRTRRRARQESEEESQRLLYVALTRAKAQLILPVFEGTGSGSFHKETGDPKGVYGVLNRRLRALLPHLEPGLFAVEDVDPAPVQPSSPTLPLEDGIRPEIPQRPDFGILAAAARPVRTVSFTSLARELNDHARPDPEEHRSPPESERPALPGGAEVGTCLHSILERVPLASAAEAGSLEVWMARADIAEVLGSALRKSLLEPRHLRELARLCFGALTQRYPLPGGGALEGLAGVARAEREVDFLLPHPDGVDFLEGSIDLLFEWQGKTYFADWKSNLLPAYDADSCRACLREKYDLQFRIYTLAACGFLEIQDQAAYEARFGGGLYVFLRGLPGGGLAADRPNWPQVMAWRREISAMGEEWTDAVL